MKAFAKQLLRGVFGAASPAEPSGSSPLAAHVDAAALAPPGALVRLGTPYGGWLMPKNSGLNDGSVCYLAGAGEDISFDCELASRYHCQVRIIDPTPRAIQHFRQLEAAIKEGCTFPVGSDKSELYDISPADFARLTFLPVGLSDRDTQLKFYLPKNREHVSCSTVNLQGTEEYFVAQCHRLTTLMAQLGDRCIDLLKMDIEGAEYSVIRDMVASGVLPRILLIEFDEVHGPMDENAPARIEEHVRLLLDAGMRCVGVEGSNMTLVRVS